MPGGSGELGSLSHYSPLTGLIYIFNLIVGTGALTLPSAFHSAGWLLSSLLMVLLAFMSFLTATFVIEAMAAANALVHWRRVQQLKRSGGTRAVSDQIVHKVIEVAAMSREVGEQEPGGRQEEEEGEGQEERPLISSDAVERVPLSVSSYYEITEITEMGRMASLFFSRGGQTAFYLCLVIYLYGDLAIYGAAVAKSVRDVACTYRPPNMTSLLNISDSEPCWADSTQSRLDAYRIFLSVFTLTIGQFVFCNVTKTKYLQVVTTLMRWLAFTVMVVLAVLRLCSQPPAHPPATRLAGLPNLFGVCVYSFMCHHSLPGLVTPINRKKRLYSLIFGDYALILCFYFLLAFTGIFAFTDVEDLYTLNFQPSEDDTWFSFSLHVFLSLFPVFTLSTNFPIIAITLSNNLKSLFLTEGRLYSYWTRSLLFPLLSLAPPLAISLSTHSLEFLVGLTGSYAGAAIQYVVPAALVYYARQEAGKALGVGVTNHHSSPFRAEGWVWFVMCWAATCVVFVTWNHVAGLWQ